MRLLAMGAFAAGCCLARSEYEKRHLTVSHYTITDDKIPDCFDGVRILLLADLHGRRFGRDNDRLYERIRAEYPDYILSAGDMILKTRPFDTSSVVRLFGRLKSLCPVFCANGNHELALRRYPAGDKVTAYDRYVGQLTGQGVTVLSDSTVKLEREGAYIAVTGLDLGLGYYARGLHVPMRENYLLRKLGEPETGIFQILMGHYPNYLDRYAHWGADLVLAGHMHGGTVRLPGKGGLMSPNYEFFPVYDRGLYRKGRTSMVVSGGLGTHSVNIRLGGNDSQLPVICLRKPRTKKAKGEDHGNRG